jgi:hypothetical protein
VEAMSEKGLHLIENQIKPNGRRKLARRGLGAILGCVRRLRTVDSKEGGGRSMFSENQVWVPNRVGEKTETVSVVASALLREESFGRCRV